MKQSHNFYMDLGKTTTIRKTCVYRGEQLHHDFCLLILTNSIHLRGWQGLGRVSPGFFFHFYCEILPSLNLITKLTNQVVRFTVTVGDPFILSNVHYNKIPVKSKYRDSALKLLKPGCSLTHKHGYAHKNITISFKVSVTPSKSEASSRKLRINLVSFLDPEDH